MNLEYFRDYCLLKKGVTEEFPFGEDVLVFKVLGKMFAASNIEEERFRVNLKCDPERSILLREEHEDIIPGWHMNKKHWNTLFMESDLSGALIKELIDHSYELVVKGLKKADKEKLANL